MKALVFHKEEEGGRRKKKKRKENEVDSISELFSSNVLSFPTGQCKREGVSEKCTVLSRQERRKNCSGTKQNTRETSGQYTVLKVFLNFRVL